MRVLSGLTDDVTIRAGVVAVSDPLPQSIRPSLVVSSTVNTSMFPTGIAEIGFLTFLIKNYSWVPGYTTVLKAFDTVSVYVA
jgi:hypothetical protein